MTQDLIIEFVARALLISAGSILGWWLLGPALNRLLGRGDK